MVLVGLVLAAIVVCYVIVKRSLPTDARSSPHDTALATQASETDAPPDTLGIQFLRFFGWVWLVLAGLWATERITGRWFGAKPIERPYLTITVTLMIIVFALGPGLWALFAAKRLRQRRLNPRKDFSPDTLGIIILRLFGWLWLVLVGLLAGGFIAAILFSDKSPMAIYPWSGVVIILIVIAFALGPGLGALFVAKMLRRERQKKLSESSE